MGNADYEERRRLEAENKLLHERRFNERLKKETASEAAALVIMEGLHAFFEGRAELAVRLDNPTGWLINFRPPPRPEQG